MIIAISVAFGLHLPAAAQIAGGLDETTRTELGGRHFIVGTVFGPDGLPVRSRTPIRLSSLTQKEVLASTDDQGKFVFSGLPNGTYTLFVDGTDEFQSAAQTVEIELSRGTSQSFATSIRLQTKQVKNQRASVVDAENAGVPKKAMEHYRKAVALVSGKDTRGAISELNAAIKEYPDFLVALTELGIQQLNLGDLSSADSNFEKALTLKPNSFEALVNRGIGLFRQKKLPAAEGYLRGSIKVKQDSDVAHFYLGRTLLGLDSLNEAEAELTAALEVSNGKLLEVHRMLTQVYIQRDDYEKALRSLDTYIAANPKAPDLEALAKTHTQLEQALALVKAQKKP